MVGASGSFTINEIFVRNFLFNFSTILLKYAYDKPYY